MTAAQSTVKHSRCRRRIARRLRATTKSRQGVRALTSLGPRPTRAALGTACWRATTTAATPCRLASRPSWGSSRILRRTQHACRIPRLWRRRAGDDSRPANNPCRHCQRRQSLVRLLESGHRTIARDARQKRHFPTTPAASAPPPAPRLPCTCMRRDGVDRPREVHRGTSPT